LNGLVLNDKSQLATTPQNNGKCSQIPYWSAVPSGAPVENEPTNKEHTNDSPSSPILDQESLAMLRQFFELLHEWDRKEDRP